MSASTLLIRGLSKRFGEQVVLDAIDLDIPLGKHITVIGRSGIGKSVFLKCIAGLLAPDSGTLLLDTGSPVPHCSYLFQQNALFDSLTVFDNVALPVREKEAVSRADLKIRVSEMLEKLDLVDAAHKYPGEISGGMQKRVALARALITQPEIILFDEPTTGLDPERKYSVFEMIRQYRLQFGFTVIMVSHDVPEVFEISDQVAWLEGGKIAFWGAPDALLENPPEGLANFIRPQLA
ncbi:MAG: ATP-binding cassette domain-containing protein [Verrucomicrobia bacterium]|nr:ATP-binding cassette domain-containing protein [Verrucomicrobiota bacterium]MDA1064983.1 ATP-binding cassette domain-containing protein [Verrucomicrobiota bacterium]